MTQVTLKGIFYKLIINSLRKEKGAQFVDNILNEIGISHISSTKNYPVEVDIKFQSILCKKLFGKEDGSSHLAVGRMYSNVISSSTVSQTFLKLIGFDVKKSCRNSLKLMEYFITGIKIEMQDLGEKKVRMIYHNYPYTPEHFQGLMTAGLEKSFKVKARIVANLDKNKTLSMDIEWD